MKKSIRIFAESLYLSWWTYNMTLIYDPTYDDHDEQPPPITWPRIVYIFHQVLGILEYFVVRLI